MGDELGVGTRHYDEEVAREVTNTPQIPFPKATDFECMRKGIGDKYHAVNITRINRHLRQSPSSLLIRDVVYCRYTVPEWVCE